MGNSHGDLNHAPDSDPEPQDNPESTAEDGSGPSVTNERCLQCSDCKQFIPWSVTCLPTYQLCAYIKTSRKFSCAVCASVFMDSELVSDIENSKKELENDLLVAIGDSHSNNIPPSPDASVLFEEQRTQSEVKEITKQCSEDYIVIDQLLPLVKGLKSAILQQSGQIKNLVEALGTQPLKVGQHTLTVCEQSTQTDKFNMIKHHPVQDNIVQSTSRETLTVQDCSQQIQAIKCQTYAQIAKKSCDVKATVDVISASSKNKYVTDKTSSHSSIKKSCNAENKGKEIRTKAGYSRQNQVPTISSDNTSSLPRVKIVHDSILNGVDANRLGHSYGVHARSIKASTIADVESLLEEKVDDVDAVVLHVGINDLKKTDATICSTALVDCVKSLSKKNPNLKIVVSRASPTPKLKELNAKRELFNAQTFCHLQNYSNVSFISHENLSSNHCYFKDNLHPSVRGSSVFAGNMGRHVQSLFWEKPRRRFFRSRGKSHRPSYFDHRWEDLYPSCHDQESWAAWNRYW